MAVIIPTANRHQTIDNWLYSAVPSLYEHNIDVIIYDSSNDDKTKAVTQNFLIDGYDNVRYSRYDGIYDGFTLDHKVMAAYREFSKEYDYVWACRDGLIVDGTVVAEKVFPAIEKEIDLIVVNDPLRTEKKLGYREYNDCKELFLEQCMQMTVFGASILKSRFINAVLDEIPLEEGRNYSLWQPFAFFEYLAGHSFCAVYMEEPIWTYKFKSPPVSFWKSKSMRQWSFEWSRNIENLPSCYDPYKKEVMKIHMSDFHPFAAKELLRIRASGGLTRKEIKENREKLRLVCDTPMWVFNVISFMPVPVAKWLASHAEGKIVKALQACFFLIRGNIPWEAKAGE